jgi:hypothetical protein
MAKDLDRCALTTAIPEYPLPAIFEEDVALL